MYDDAGSRGATDSETKLLTDTRGFESQRGYTTITDGGKQPAPVPTLLQMAPPPPEADRSLEQLGGGRSSLYPSEIRGTMQNPYRGKFAEAVG